MSAVVFLLKAEFWLVVRERRVLWVLYPEVLGPGHRATIPMF